MTGSHRFLSRVDTLPVFSRSVAVSSVYTFDCKLTKRLCRVIQDCRAAIAKQRNERQRQATKEKRVAAAAEMAQVITELHGRDEHPRTTLEDLLSGPWRERVSYRRRREHVEREEGKEKERKRLWQETQRQRRQLKRKERARLIDTDSNVR